MDNKTQQTGGGSVWLGSKFVPQPISVGTVSNAATVALFNDFLYANQFTKPGLLYKDNYKADLLSAQSNAKPQIQAESVIDRAIRSYRGMTRYPAS